jgi:hypothetical protein
MKFIPFLSLSFFYVLFELGDLRVRLGAGPVVVSVFVQAIHLVSLRRIQYPILCGENNESRISSHILLYHTSASNPNRKNKGKKQWLYKH